MDIHEAALEIIKRIDYDLWKEVTAEPFEDDIIENVKDVLYDYKQSVILEYDGRDR